MTEGPGTPYDTTAVSYHLRGWHPFPLWNSDPDVPRALRGRDKKMPPAGITGRDGRFPSRDEIENWRDEGRYFNIGTRLPVNVVAIDVDAYHGGAETLATLESKLGKLPETYTVTARTDGSGHRYFQVPGKRIWQNPGKGIDIIHWGWRYTVLPPSIHPSTGTPYQWFGPDGQALGNQLGPKPEQLPMLPASWVAHIDTKADPNVSTAKAALSRSESWALIKDWASDGELCRHMVATLEEAFSSNSGGRHDACMRAQMKLLRYGEAGHPGAYEAINTLMDWFITSLEGERDGTSEWTRGLIHATRRIAANPTSRYQRGCRAPIKTSKGSIPVQISRITLPTSKTNVRSGR